MTIGLIPIAGLCGSCRKETTLSAAQLRLCAQTNRPAECICGGTITGYWPKGRVRHG